MAFHIREPTEVNRTYKSKMSLPTVVVGAPCISKLPENAVLAGKIVSKQVQGLRSGSVRRLCFKKTSFQLVKLLQVICGICSLIPFMNFNGSDDGTINETSGSTNARLVTKTNDTYELALLIVARYSAFSMYPVVILVMFTKYRATYAFFNTTAFSVFLTQKSHALHVYCGWYIMIGSIVHTISHCLRWINQGNIQLLYTNRSAITGLIVIFSTIVIVAPMTILKKIANFEMRKFAHSFFWVFCIAMAFHAPIKALPQAGYCCLVFPILIGWYCLDAAYVHIFMSERIDSVEYKAVKGGVELTMMVSDRFSKRIHGGFGFVMAPWISKYQWHAFSIYQDPDDDRRRHMFVANIGDWTSKMHDTIESGPTARPLWISGPFPSPYNDCINYDNAIFVGAGVGITPAVSAIQKYRESRRCNLIWAVRDVSMLIFFLKKMVLDEKAVNVIFYTGKEPLPEDIENYRLLHDAHVHIVKSRPDIKLLIPNIINYFENPSSEFNKSKKKASKSSLIIDHGNDVPLELPSSGDCACKDAEIQSSDKTLATAPMWSTGRTMRTRDSLSTLDSGFGNFVPLDVSCDRKCISVHDMTSSTVKKTKLTAFEIALEEIEEVEERSSKGRRKHLRKGKASSVKQDPKVWEANPRAKEYLENHFPEKRRDTWGLMYCGGRNPILEKLREESKAMKIRLREEVFEW